jgi:hypothetical protein
VSALDRLDEFYARVDELFPEEDTYDNQYSEEESYGDFDDDDYDEVDLRDAAGRGVSSYQTYVRVPTLPVITVRINDTIEFLATDFSYERVRDADSYDFNAGPLDTNILIQIKVNEDQISRIVRGQYGAY